MGTSTKHPFEGGYIEVSEEAYLLLRSSGASDNWNGVWDAQKGSDVFFISNGDIGSTYLEDLDRLNCEKLCIIDGAIAWAYRSDLQQICDNPDVISASRSCSTVVSSESVKVELESLDAMAILKGKFATGEYVVYFCSEGCPWQKTTKLTNIDIFNPGTEKFMSIKKEHSLVVDAVVDNPSKFFISYSTNLSSGSSSHGTLNSIDNFFQTYDECNIYSLVEYGSTKHESAFKVDDEVSWYGRKGKIAEIGTVAASHTTYLVKFEDGHRDMYLGDGVLKLWDDGAIEKESNDGGKNDFYTFAPYVKNVDSLSRFLGLSFSEGNILKSLTSNLGDRHDGTDAKREAKKCLHYAVERMLYTFTPEEILSQIQKQLKGN